MPEIISNTSPLQYLHRKSGLNLPDIQNLDWISVRLPSSSIALPMVTVLGAGERQVLTLALETADAICVLDDALARRIAGVLQLRIAGTLGILIDAKRAGLITAVRPQLDQLHSLGFRLAAHTRAAVLKMSGETER